MNARSGGAAALLATVALALVPAASIAAEPRAAAPLAHDAQLTVRRCSARSEARCGSVVVPLDRSGAVPGRLALHVRTLDGGPSGGRDGKPSIVALAGGPGQAATPLLEQIADGLGAARAGRRIVTFDQRGTGRSGRLSCPSLQRIRRRSEVGGAVGACARRLGARAGLYTSAASVEDIEAVRSALGEEQIVLYAVSYGTKVALDYAARHPEHVSRLVLDSVVPQSGNDPFWRATIAAVPRVLSTLCGRSCGFTRSTTADLATLVRRTASRPLTGRVYDGRGRGRTAGLRGDNLFAVLLAGDFSPEQRAQVPGALRSAVAGDSAPLLRLALLAGGGAGDPDSGDSDALYFATTCTDGEVPWPAGTPVADRPAAFSAQLAALPAEQLAPFDRRTLRLLGVDGCRAWPGSPLAQPTAPLPDVPVLMLSGAADLRTPTSDAVALAAQLPRARVVTVPGVGHSVLGSAAAVGQRCALRAVTAFLAERGVGGCGRTRLPRVLPPAPRRLGELAPLPGMSPRVGRTLRAFLLTYGDALQTLLGAISQASGEQRSFGAGGLRGGAVRFSAETIVLDRYSALDGVTISLRQPAGDDGDEPFAVTVGGPAAARGRLVLSERGLRGRLGGRAVRLDARQARSLLGGIASASASAPGGGPQAAATAALRGQFARLEQLRAALPAR